MVKQQLEHSEHRSWAVVLLADGTGATGHTSERGHSPTPEDLERSQCKHLLAILRVNSTTHCDRLESQGKRA